MNNDTKALIAFFENHANYKKKKYKGKNKRFVNEFKENLFDISPQGVVKFSKSGKVKDLVELSEVQLVPYIEAGRKLI